VKRQRALTAAAIVLAAATIWAASAELAWPARAWTTFLLAILPPLLVLQSALVHELRELPRSSVYVSSGISLWVLAGVTLVATLTSGLGMEALGLVTASYAKLAAWSLAGLIGGILVLLLAHELGVREAVLLRQILPVTPRERALFVGLSVTAGICEELVFRGFLIVALLSATGSLALALLLSSAVFGLLHAYQQPAGALRAATLGLLLAVPLLATGSIIPSMIAHAAIDIVAGLWLKDLLLR
jgi:membrane protease YdiL (CAAX protease family)